MSAPTRVPTADDSDTGVEITPAELGATLDGEMDSRETEQARKAAWPDGGPQVAGVALVAADTGRVLMIQRALDPDDESDPARGTWEFPGGHLEPDDATDLHGAMREWAEEVGQPIPTAAVSAHRWENGLYRGHVLVIPAENALDLSAERSVHNPDDDAEQVAWWDPADARKNPALRRECRRSPWSAIARAATAGAHEGKALPDRYLTPLRIAHPDPWDDLLTGVEVKDQQPGRQTVANTGRPEGPASAQRVSGAPASVADDKKKSGKKRKVASQAGEKRYGLPIGTELGKARDKNAEGAQKDKAAQGLYEQLRKTDPAKYRELLDKMSPGDLQKLSRLLYSSRSSVPAIVAARVAVANALKRKGLDVNNSGGLGRAARKGPATPAPRKPGRASDRVKGNSVNEGQVSAAEWDQLLREGWKGRPGDGAERLYRPGTKGADMDGIEVKRTTTKPGKTGTAQDAGKTIGAKKGDDGDEYPIRTIGDVATALKRAKAIKDPDRKREVMAHIRSGAKKINAGNMVPSDDDSDKGTGKKKGGKGGPPPWVKGKKSADTDGYETTDFAALADEIDAKVMSPDPNATRLREYWAHGEGRAKWRPGTPGDFERLRAQVKRYIPKRMLNGFVANVHKLATGEWPGKNAHGGKAAEPVETDILITASEVKDALGDPGGIDSGLDADPGADPLGDDAVTLALDSYGDMADSLTSTEEYEAALAGQVDWELTADGHLTETVDPHAERGPGTPEQDSDDGDDYDPADMLAELAESHAG